jgi:hypothetical protein
MNKRLLAVAVGAVVSAGALATPVVDDSMKNVYATESLNATTPTVDGANIAITQLGTGVTNANQLFVRMDLSGGVKTVAAPVLTSAGNFSSITVAQGGVGSAYTVFSLTAGGNTNITDSATIDPGTLSVPGTNVASTVTVCTYDSLSNAVNQTGSLGCDTHASYLSFVTGVALAASTNELVASVDTDYKQFVNTLGGAAVNTGWLGSHNFSNAPNVLDAQTGANVDLVNIVNLNASVVTYAGDFSVGNFFIAPDNTCGGLKLDLVETANNVPKTAITANLDVVNGGTLCVTEPGTTAIPVANYTVAVDLAGVATKVPPADVGATGFGSIVRDGTQIEVDYLTTFSGYNQRVLMTNRGNRDYTYETTFTTEAGVTATPGAAATGTLKAGQVTVVKVSDMVTFTGGTRGSGVITIPATAGTVDAAATQVNLSDGGTDTVYLD